MNEDLRRFLLVAREGHLTRTAEKLFITQSALTQSIHRLEKELHTKLFQSHGKYLQLTAEGKSMVLIGEKIHSLWDTAKSPYISNFKIPTYAIGLFDNVALRLSSFFRDHIQTNEYKLELTISSSGRLLSQLQLGTLDAAICVIDPTENQSKYLTLLQTFEEKLLPVSAKHFSGKTATIPFILYNQGSNTRKQIDTIFLQQGIQPTIFAESTSTTFMKELALLGSGVALLPENVIKTELKQGKLKIQKMPVTWRRKYSLILPRNGTLEKNHPFIKELLKMLTR